jgi:hypothetical protein
MAQLVTQMLDLHKHLHAASSDAAREIYQRQIAAMDRATAAVSRCVGAQRKLYGLAEEEIKVVEATNPRQK